MATIPFDLNAKLTLTGTCPVCKGSGDADGMDARCSQCGRIYSDAEQEEMNRNFDPTERNQPCGCLWIHYREVERRCSACEGSGKLTWSPTVAELFEAFRRMDSAFVR